MNVRACQEQGSVGTFSAVRGLAAGMRHTRTFHQPESSSSVMRISSPLRMVSSPSEDACIQSNRQPRHLKPLLHSLSRGARSSARTYTDGEHAGGPLASADAHALTRLDLPAA